MAATEAVALRFGSNLLRARRDVALSQEQAALRAGLHRTEVGLLEHGGRTPRIDTLLRLSAAVECDPGRLLYGIEWAPAAESAAGAFYIMGGE
ncbi:MAG: helix-turn-helix transcriptional regulator [Solirubrobacterales bacterium]